MKKHKEFIIKALPLKLTKTGNYILDNIIKEEVKMLKDHFREDGWDIDARFSLDTVLSKYFEKDLPFILYSRIVRKIKGTEIIYRNGVPTIVSIKDKVYYNPIKNLMYTSKVKRNIINDITIGDL